MNKYTYCGSNPVSYHDPKGLAWETVLDVASLISSSYDMITSPSWVNLGFLAWDIGATLVPFAPGSYSGKAVKAVTKYDELLDVGKTLGKVDDILKSTVTVIKNGDLTPGGWKITSHVAEQLNEGGRLYGELSLSQVDDLLNSADALRYIDSKTANINIFVDSCGLSAKSYLRITVPIDGKRLISIGFQEKNRIPSRIKNGRLIELFGGN